MARLIPDINPDTIKNYGERAFYEAAKKLPDEYTVMYSYAYKQDESVWEIDFVITHPALGFATVEVKNGYVSYHQGQWLEDYQGTNRPLHKNPVEQAKRAMHNILRKYGEKGLGYFPLKVRYAVAFPESTSISGDLPADLTENSIFLFADLDNLELKLLGLFDGKDRRHDREERILVDKILAPSFKVSTRLDHQIEMFKSKATKVLAEEQERILRETELDKRKIFLGAAGTGKTFLAMEKAQRLNNEGKKVFLTCYNRNLARYVLSERLRGVIVGNFHDYVEEFLGLHTPLDNLQQYYDEDLPNQAFDYFSNGSSEEKFDAIVVDEGQDFKEAWVTVLESMLKDDGEFYIFADPDQNLFNTDSANTWKMEISKHRLTRNLRNTEAINDWITRFVPREYLQPVLHGGLPVSYFPWKDEAEEKRLIEREIGRLVSQGISPKRITILSPHRKEKSSLANVDRIKEWTLEDISERGTGLKFSTIRSFKGLEADIVFLIGIKESKVCTKQDVYVGGSRARYLLYIFYHHDWSVI